MTFNFPTGACASKVYVILNRLRIPVLPNRVILKQESIDAGRFFIQGALEL